MAVSFDRQEKIKSILSAKGAVMLHELETVFPSVTPMTLRRDLYRLEEEGLVEKIRGGVRVKSVTPGPAEPAFDLRAAKNREGKRRIAEAALKYIETDRSAYLDAGSTMMAFASLLPDINFIVVTSGPNIAMEVLKRRHPTVNLVGGQVNLNNLCVSGRLALDFIKNVNIDIAFIAPSGFSVRDGFTCGNYGEAELKRAVIKKANRVILLMDSNKVGKSLTFTFAHLKDIDVLITDEPLPESMQPVVQKNGMEMIVVP